MPFLSSQRSLNSPVIKPSSHPSGNSRKAHKDGRRPSENDRDDDASGTSSRESLMRRMAAIFRPKRKLPASGSNSRNRSAVGCMYIAPDLHRPTGGPVESESDDESDIRCPSGLGSAVSLAPPPPSTPPLPGADGTDNPKVAETSDGPSVGIHNGPKASSSPNLLRSLSQKVKNKLRRRGTVGNHDKPPPQACHS